MVWWENTKFFTVVAKSFKMASDLQKGHSNPKYFHLMKIMKWVYLAADLANLLFSFMFMFRILMEVMKIGKPECWNFSKMIHKVKFNF